MCCRCGRATIKAQESPKHEPLEIREADLQHVNSTRISVSSLEDLKKPPSQLNFEFAKSNSLKESLFPQQEDNLSPEALIESAFITITQLCHYARVIEAHDTLHKLLRTLDDSGRALVHEKIKMLPIISKMERIHGLMAEVVGFTLVPGLREDVTWTHFELKDAAIAPNFRLEVFLRLAQGAEVQKDGASSQMILRALLYNFPTSLERFMLLQAESDLTKPEWIKDCEAIKACGGGEEHMYQSLIQALLAPALLPMRLQETFLRSIAVCEEAPFSSSFSHLSGPGVLIWEQSPPDGAAEFEGHKVPGSAHKRALAMKALKMMYAVASADPDAVDLLAVARIGIPAPQWIIPLSLVKRVCADLMHQSFKTVKAEVINKWQSLPFDARAAACPSFYRQFFETTV